MPFRPPALVIFDCDGVLVDTERLAVPIDVEILAELGWKLTREEVIGRFLGKSAADVRLAIEEHLGHSIPEQVSLEHDRRYREAFSSHLRPVEGVVEVLDLLDAAGIAACVASGGSHEKMRFTLSLTGLYERFEGRIFSAYDVPRGKPAPDLFVHALSVAAPGAAAADCAVVEDSRFGIDAAHAAGMRAFAYAGGLMPVERLRAPGTIVFRDMKELPNLLGL